MSIETDLGRIATALEQMVKLCSASKETTSVHVTVPSGPAAKSAKKQADKPVPAVESVVESDPFQSESPAQEELTEAKLGEFLKTHATTFGTKATIALIKKHGADPVTPKINTIPQANWQACYNEAKEDMLKKKG